MSCSHRLVVFDLDRTLMKKNVSAGFIRYLWKNKQISASTLFSVYTYRLAYKASLVNTSQLHQAAYRCFLEGKNYDALCRLASDYVETTMRLTLSSPLFQRLQNVCKKGDLVAILSSSPDFLVRVVSRTLSVSLWKGTTYSLDREGKIRGVRAVMGGSNKLKWVQSFCAGEEISLQNVTVYTDSIEDFPLLQCVGTPIGVNPDWKLHKKCRELNWEVIPN